MKADNAKPETKYRELSPAEQAQRIASGKLLMYEMKMVFKGDVCMSPLGGFGKSFGLGDMRMDDAATLSMSHIAPFIPDGETLKKYAEILENTSREADTRLSNVRFAGYESVRVVKRVDPPGNEMEDTP